MDAAEPCWCRWCSGCRLLLWPLVSGDGYDGCGPCAVAELPVLPVLVLLPVLLCGWLLLLLAPLERGVGDERCLSKFMR